MPVIRQWPIAMIGDRKLQHSSIQLDVAGWIFPWITETSYGHKLEPGEARGISPYPMGTTLGEYKAEASLTIHRDKREIFFRLIESLGPGYMEQFFPVRVAHQDFGLPMEVDRFRARLTGVDQDSQAGNGVILSKLGLYVGYINMNGHAPTSGVPQNFA